MSDELKELREILKTLEQHGFSLCVTDTVRQRIAKLEAEADPWREAKDAVSRWTDTRPTDEAAAVVGYVRHLESENAVKDSAIVRLTTEAEKAEKGVRDFMWELKDRREELDKAEARIAELEAREVPPLDRARVIKTAMSFMARNFCSYQDWKDAEPYQLQEPK